jgi:hypothetical protein
MVSTGHCSKIPRRRYTRRANDRDKVFDEADKAPRNEFLRVALSKSTHFGNLD